jgi:L-alanine-DL-glutamate epimerase-like enolase superfamily enzyme
VNRAVDQQKKFCNDGEVLDWTVTMSFAPISNVELLHFVEDIDRSNDLDGSNATLVVRITDSDGVSGIGECDAPPEAIAALFDMPAMHAWAANLRAPLIGADPLEFGALGQKLYQASFWHGRRGLAIHAISGIDIALHDLVARRLGVPVWKLLGGARRPVLTPYATIFPGLPNGRPIKALTEQIAGQMERARALGFRAVKMELLFDQLATDRDLVRLIQAGREAVGDETTLMLDFGYRWNDWHDALFVLKKVENCDIYFAEATLQHDDLAGHKALSSRAPTRICGAEAAATRFEVREWIVEGGISVVQADIGRAGGFTEMRRIAELCEMHGVQCVPHCWKTGILAMSALHFQAATPNVPFVEYLHPELYDSELRRQLVRPSTIEIADGKVELPTAPGLGIELNMTIPGSSEAVPRGISIKSA